jgi:spoIIIJ-associated protein
MKIYNYEGKTIEDAKKKALDDLKLSEEELLIKEKELESGLFKAKKIKIDVLIKDEIIEYAKELVSLIAKQMGINVNIEVKKRPSFIKINLFSDNNAILIGKGGKTIEALQMILKHSIYSKTGIFANIVLDVEDYKDKQQRNIEGLAKRLAREVESTGIEVKMEDMNSYERRLVHETLADMKNVYTVSEGDEPNRHIVIKPKNE